MAAVMAGTVEATVDMADTAGTDEDTGVITEDTERAGTGAEEAATCCEVPSILPDRISISHPCIMIHLTLKKCT